METPIADAVKSRMTGNADKANLSQGGRGPFGLGILGDGAPLLNLAGWREKLAERISGEPRSTGTGGAGEPWVEGGLRLGRRAGETDPIIP